MLEELKNKNVKMLVGSNSGIASRTDVATSILTLIGTFKDYDDKMVKLSTVEISGAIPGVMDFRFGSGNVLFKATAENYNTIYVNRDSIITIATMEE